MSELQQKSRHDNRHLQVALVCVAAVTLIRIVVLVVSPLELYPDEAQYWWWAQKPAFGYFSKPPMIAWIVWAATALLGDGEWAIRVVSPVLHALTSIVVFAIARRLFDSRVALLSALAYLTTPGACYSSGLISTDVPLLFFWAMALAAFLRAREETDWRWPVLCGIAVGLGLLAKYAMLYFLLGAAVAALVDAPSRRLVLGARGGAILLIGLLIVAPNIVWNAEHGFPTLAHTESNAAWGRAKFSPLSVGEFFAGQFGVFGPLLAASFLAALWRLGRERPVGHVNNGELILATFSVPPLILMFVQSFIVTANANWAATAYVAAVPLAVLELLRWWGGRALWASFAVNGAAMLLLWLVVAAPTAGERLGLGNAFKREEGWRTLGRYVATEAARTPFDAIAASNRSVIAELLYYARPRGVPLKAWMRGIIPRDHFQMTMRLSPPARRVLVVVAPQEARGVLSSFDSANYLGTLVTPIGGHHLRVTQLYDARVYRGS